MMIRLIKHLWANGDSTVEAATSAEAIGPGPLDKQEKIFLGLVFVFTVINWALLAAVEKLGPPDFYKMHDIGAKLFSGELKVGIIPPLFPLLLYPLGKLFALFMPAQDAFIWSGRVISLAAGTGVILFTYLFLRRFCGKWALPALLMLIVSPWYLKLLAFPITDMLGLLMVTAAFYSFAAKNWKLSLVSMGAGILTRFEAVLLIAAAGINYFKAGKRFLLMTLLGGLPILGLLTTALYFFTPRFFLHLEGIILAKKSYLNVFLHPLDFANLFYGNLLFFIPSSFHVTVKWSLLFCLIALFIYGMYRLLQTDKRLAVAMMIYEIMFLAAKGYVNPQDPEREFRRILPALWIFYIAVFLGGFFLLKRITATSKNKIPVIIAISALLLITAAVLKPAHPAEIWPLLVFVPLLFLMTHMLKIDKWPKYLMPVILLVFALQMYHPAMSKAEHYVDSYARKAAYATAQWLNHGNVKEGSTVFSFTDNLMVNYYLKKNLLENRNINIMIIRLPFPNSPENRERFKIVFLREIRRKNVDYVIFDHYVVNQPEFAGFNDIHRLLWEEKENTDIFRLKHLSYKGKSVGFVLRPVNVETYR